MTERAVAPEVQRRRQRIDALDRQLVELLAERARVVRELADLKRRHHIPIRDDARERAMHEMHARWAEELALPPRVVDGLFRLVLWASRNMQAELRTDVPLDAAPRRVLVVGGEGAMGQRFAEAFAALGNEVLSADRDTALRAAEAARQVDVIVFAVPIDVTEAVIAEVAPHARPGALLMDITSVKVGPVAAMRRAAPHATVIGTHPLFGPAVSSFQGQRVVVTPAEADRDGDAGEADAAWLDWLTTSLRGTGLDVVDATPADHDRIMSVVQVLTHYSTEVLGQTLARLEVSLEETLRFTSPVYYIDMLMAARHFAQPASLYAAIQTGNPFTARVTRTFQEVAGELAGVVSSGDAVRFGRVFDEVRGFFGPFSEKALDESRYLIDRLVERR